MFVLYLNLVHVVQQVDEGINSDKWDFGSVCGQRELVYLLWAVRVRRRWMGSWDLQSPFLPRLKEKYKIRQTGNPEHDHLNQYAYNNVNATEWPKPSFTNLTLRIMKGLHTHTHTHNLHMFGSLSIDVTQTAINTNNGENGQLTGFMNRTKVNQYTGWRATTHFQQMEIAGNKKICNNCCHCF